VGLGVSWVLVTFLTVIAFNSVDANATGTSMDLGVNVYGSTPDADGWKLVWQDEFNDSNLNTNYWKYDIDGKGGGNNELQYYSDSPLNSYIENGSLVIKALNDGYAGRAYTSAKIRSKHLAEWTYGKFEIRAKLPVGQGMWPAIWMMPSENIYGTWPMSGEIDIMEYIGREPNKIHGTIHYGDRWPKNKSTTGKYTSSKSLTDDYHVFSIEWEPNKISWYIDGILYSTKTPKDLHGRKWVWDQKFYLIINLAVGGNWPGSPDKTTVFPQKFYIDYVRVYQR
jgi:beta-glucanase (GH16 family)